MSLNDSEPPPHRNEHQACWDTFLDRHEFRELPDDVRALIEADIRERDERGGRKYGVRLQPFNGRNALHDIYQEQLDALVYSVQFFVEDCQERRGADPFFDALHVFQDALRTVERTRRVIRRREGR